MIKKLLIPIIVVSVLIHSSFVVVHTLNEFAIMRHLLNKQDQYIDILEQQVELLQNELFVPPECEKNVPDLFLPWEEEIPEIEPSIPEHPYGKTLWGA